MQPHEIGSDGLNPSDGVTLNEDEYRYVLNDASDYNSIIPQYLENDVNDFMFNVEYYNGSVNGGAGVNNGGGVGGTGNSNYSMTNLESNAQNYTTATNTNTYDSVMFER